MRDSWFRRISDYKQQTQDTNKNFFLTYSFKHSRIFDNYPHLIQSVCQNSLLCWYMYICKYGFLGSFESKKLSE